MPKTERAIPAGLQTMMSSCGDAPVPGEDTGKAAGAKTATIIIQNPPYRGDNKAWHALRFSGALLAEGLNVRVHLLDDGVAVGKRGQPVPEGAVNLEALLTELMEYGLQVSACGLALDGCRIPEGEMIPGISRGSMKTLASLANSSDMVLTF